MTFDDDTRALLLSILGGTKIETTRVAGGDVNETFLVDTSAGGRAFVKTHARAPIGMFEAEARSLELLRQAARRGQAEKLVVPRVLAVGPRFLALEAIDFVASSSTAEETFGRELALVHAAPQKTFGDERDGFVATLHRDNTPCADWPTFYRTRRIAPQLALDPARRLVPADLRRALERLLEKDDVWGPAEPPALLHGDLWSGNWGATAEGPVVFDPACYGGHREIDLAMLQLFGAPGARFFAAYDEVAPRAPGHEKRVPLYQLDPLLTHVNLFGASYLPSLADAVRRAGG